MNLTKVYANYSGIKLPEKTLKINTHFYPLPDKDYICIEYSKKNGALNYDYFNEVISWLKKYNLDIVQIGHQEDTLLNGVADFRGKCSLSQVFYLISHSKLLLGGDTEFCYAANNLDVPTVTLYGPTLSNSNKPHYRHPKSIFIDSDRNGFKPTYDLNENPKTINFIKVEAIVEAVLSILDIKPTILPESCFVGEGYSSFVFEALPIEGTAQSLNPAAFINIRLDREFNEQEAFNILTKGKGSIVTNKPINKTFFNNKNLVKLIYQVNKLEDLNINFIKYMESKGVDYQMTTENPEILSELKFALLDYRHPVLKKPVFIKENMVGKSFKSTRVLFAGDKTYLSYWHYLNKLPQPEKSLEGVIFENMDLTFWENQDSIYLYETKQLV